MQAFRPALAISSFLGLVILFGASPSRADELEIVKGRLVKQVQLIEAMEPFVERPDLGRLYFLKGASLKAIDVIDKNGLANAKTFQEFQSLIIAYRYSQSFFQEVETARTREAIGELLRLYLKICDSYGIDDSPYTMITRSVYRQMHKLILQMMGLVLPDALRAKLDDLKVPLGKVIAQADQGDRRLIYDTSVPLYRKIVALYPDFNRISSGDTAYNIVLEIQGLNEFYGEFAQVEKGGSPELLGTATTPVPVAK